MNYRTLLQKKNYRNLWIAGLINRFGDSVDAIAFTWLIYQISQSAGVSALNFGLNFVPTILLQPIMGAIVEKRNKKRIVIMSDLGRGVVVLIIGLLTYFHLVESWMILCGTLCLSTLEAFRMPAGTAMIPLVLEEEEYTVGQSLSSSTSKTVELLGIACAGVILGVGGVYLGLFIDAATFFISAWILMGIQLQEVIQEPLVKGAEWVLLKEGFQYLKKSENALFLCLLGTLLNALLVPFNALSSAFVVEVYHMGPEVLSILEIAISVGMIVGAIFYPKISETFLPKWIIFTCFLSSGIFYFVLVACRYLVLQPTLFYICLLAISFVLGVSVACLGALNSVMLLKKIPQDYLARISSVFVSISVASIPLFSFIISLLSVWFSTSPIFIFAGMVTILFGIGLLASPWIKRMQKNV